MIVSSSSCSTLNGLLKLTRNVLACFSIALLKIIKAPKIVSFETVVSKKPTVILGLLLIMTDATVHSVSFVL